MNQFPPLSNQITNLVADTKKIFAESGIDDILCNDELIQNRLKLCGECQHWKSPRCMMCGCFMETKARFKALKCPIGRW
jgi:hypothetical protein